MSEHDEGTRYADLRTRAIESLLIEKGLLSETAVDVVVDAYGSDIGPLHGARVVARAWTDPEFKARLLDDATPAARELGVGGFVSEYVRCVENVDGLHNIVVCTLCSCYPWGLLGLPPTWYKSPEYRARTVREPRAVLREFGVELPEETEIRDLGLERGPALHRAAAAPRGHGRPVRGRARRARHARVDDRHRPRADAGRMSPVDPSISQMPGLPRQNGELVFAEPWQARAFGVAIALCEQQGIDWEVFRSRLIAEIGAWEREHGPGAEGWDYYERWLASLERLVSELGLVGDAEVAARVEQLAHADRHDHDHDHGHDH